MPLTQKGNVCTAAVGTTLSAFPEEWQRAEGNAVGSNG